MDVRHTKTLHMILYVALNCLPASYPQLSHDDFSNDRELPQIHISSVQCNGNETMLSECSIGELELDYCREGISEAGVICTSTYV